MHKRNNYTLLFIPKNPSWFEELPEISNTTIVCNKISLGKFEKYSSYEEFGLKERCFELSGDFLNNYQMFSENGLFSKSYFQFNDMNDISVKGDTYVAHMESISKKQVTSDFLKECARIKMNIPYIEIEGANLIRYLLDIDGQDYRDIETGNKYIVLDSKGHKELKLGSIIDRFSYLSTYNDVIIDNNYGCRYFKYVLRNINLFNEKQEISLNKATRGGISCEKVLDIIDDLLEKNVNPDWLIYENLIVVAPKFRPLIYHDEIKAKKYELDKINLLYLQIIQINNDYLKAKKYKTSILVLNKMKNVFDDLVSSLYVELTKYYIYCGELKNEIDNQAEFSNLNDVINLILLKKYNDAESRLLTLCSAHNSDAMLMLGDLYSKDLYKLDKSMVYKCYELASSLGNEMAKRRLIEAYLFRECGLEFEYNKVKEMVDSLKQSRIKKVYLNILKEAKPESNQEKIDRLLKAIFENQ